LYRRDGEWTQIGWDDAIALWANALREAIAKDGAGSAGAIGGGRLLNEEAFLLQHVYRALGIENLDWRAGRMQHAHPGAIGGTPVDLENAQVIIQLGRSLAQSAPVLDLRVRKAVAHKGARVLPVGPGATFDDAVKAIPAGTVRIALTWDGEPFDFAPVQAWLTALGAGTEVRVFVPGEQPNARGAESIGLLPRDGGLDTQAMFEAARDGKLATLALLGVNPVLHWPDRKLAIEALEATPFVVVSDLFLTETGDLADLVLPACSAFEKTGTTTNLSGDVLPVVAGVPAPGEAWADGDMLVALAEALGVTLPAPGEIEARVQVLVSQPPAVPSMPAVDSAPRAMVERDTLRVIVETTIFTGGGTLAHDTRIEALRTPPRATINPQSAALLELAAGDEIDLAGPDGVHLDGLRVVVDERVPPGYVALVAGLPSAPLNALRGALSVTVAAKRSPHELAEARA
jgi:predicted molibdopterin-dependent oxidoreductase YjgC